MVMELKDRIREMKAAGSTDALIAQRFTNEHLPLPKGCSAGA
jgi:hypothetical protein